MWLSRQMAKVGLSVKNELVNEQAIRVELLFLYSFCIDVWRLNPNTYPVLNAVSKVVAGDSCFWLPQKDKKRDLVLSRPPKKEAQWPK